MGYTDTQGRPELVMHPDIKRGGAGYRLEKTPPETPDRADDDVIADDQDASPGMLRAR